MYQKPKKYTSQELIEVKLADLRIDICCAKRDGLHEYAQECQRKYQELIKELNG